jgi:hypothetical protein
MTKWLYETLFISEAGWWIGGIGVYLGLAALVWLFLGRFSSVRMGPDPVIPLSEAVTVEMPIVPALPVKPNYVPDFRLHEYYPLAPDSTVTAQLAAVAAFLERTETVTVTREIVLTIPAARHRLEDMHSETRNLAESVRRAKVLEAGRPQ